MDGTLVKLTLSENREEAESSLSKCWVQVHLGARVYLCAGKYICSKKAVACKTRKRKMEAE